jgi:hypothetical protein
MAQQSDNGFTRRVTFYSGATGPMRAKVILIRKMLYCMGWLMKTGSQRQKAA